MAGNIYRSIRVSVVGAGACPSFHSARDGVHPAGLKHGDRQPFTFTPVNLTPQLHILGVPRENPHKLQIGPAQMMNSGLSCEITGLNTVTSCCLHYVALFLLSNIQKLFTCRQQ